MKARFLTWILGVLVATPSIQAKSATDALLAPIRITPSLPAPGGSFSAKGMGHATGNGGDHIRGTFMRMGEAVLSYLSDTTEGAAVVTKNRLDIGALRDSLQATRIDVVEGLLLDNGGVPVDATGTADKITLNKDRWIEHFEKDRDVYYLVFHEMLRSAVVNDDDYIISKSLRPFPVTRRIVTRISSLYPLVGEQQIADWFATDKMTLSGSGCPKDKIGTSADFDFERNVLDLAFRDYDLRTRTETREAFDRKACGLAIPILVPAGHRLVISQIDMTAKFELAPTSLIKITSEAFLAGDRSPVQEKSFETKGEAVLGRLLERSNDVLRTPCGGSAILRLNTSAYMSSEASASSAASVDRVSLSFKVEKCP